MQGDMDAEIEQLMHNNSGLKAIILKQGSNGSTAYTRCDESKIIQKVHQPVYSDKSGNMKIVDTAGAGDVFTGAFAVRYAETGGDSKEAMRFANTAAFVSITKLGCGSECTPKRDAVDTLLEDEFVVQKVE